MRLFIYEYTCAAALDEHPKLAALRTEGQAMLSAVLQDAARLPDVEPVTILNPASRLSNPPNRVRLRRLDRSGEETAFHQEAGAADFSWVIAPECDDILASRCRWVAEAGGRSLNCSPAAIALAGDKLALAEVWRARGLATPLALPWPGPVPADFLPVVWKPCHGAGSQATFMVRSPQELDEVDDLARAEGYAGPAVVTRYVPGLPASSAWLVGPDRKLPLPPARQILSEDGRFHYQGGELPLAPELAERAVRLCRAALDAVPGLLGYVGIDLILGHASDGSADSLIELNPRLTTSYLGLRALARFNLVQALLDVVQGKEVELQWHAGPVRFTASTLISVHPC